MKNKIIALVAVFAIFTAGLLYFSPLQAGDKDGKKNCDYSSCSKQMNKGIKAGGEWEKYEFVTDKACCDEMRNNLKSEALKLSGVKEVNFSKTCGMSKMSSVIIYYSASETNSDAIAASLKDKNFDCPSMPGCEKDCSKGCDKNSKSGNEQKECPHNNTNKEKKDI
jgi:hypothetical protein